MQDFFKQQSDWIKTWQESQEKLTKQYAELSEDWTSSMLGKKNKTPDFFEGWFSSQGDLEGQFKEFGKRMNEMLGNLLGNKLPPDVLKYVDMSFFEQYYKNWLSNIELPGGIKNPLGMDGGWQQTAKFLQSFMANDNPFFSSFNSTNMADQMSRLFGMLQGTMGQDGSSFGNLLSGYQEFFNKLFEASTAQNTEKLAEGFETWVKEMEKNLSAPKLGINREMTHDFSKALLLSKDYIQVFSKMAKLVEATSRKAGTRFQAKLSEAALKNRPVNKFADICALWAVENEAVFLEVMGTQEFAKLQGEYIDAGHRLKIQWNKLAEKALEPTPIALKRDLDLAIAEIHQLKRDMRTFKREMQQLGKEAHSAREAQAAAVEEAKKARLAAQDEAKKAKAAEAVAKNEAKKARAAETAAEKLVKPVLTASKTAKPATGATTKTTSKNV